MALAGISIAGEVIWEHKSKLLAAATEGLMQVTVEPEIEKARWTRATQSLATPLTLRSHRRRFVPDFENFKIATKSQFVLTILVHHSLSWKQIGNQNLSGRKFQHVEIFSPILESVPIW